jgi:uncharacterized membrane protein
VQWIQEKQMEILLMGLILYRVFVFWWFYLIMLLAWFLCKMSFIVAKFIGEPKEFKQFTIDLWRLKE